MNTIADMGGMHGFGAIDHRDQGGPFHYDWERRILGISFATLGANLFNVDEIHRATELIPPAAYLRMSYFERWLESTEVLLVEKGIISKDELARRRVLADSAVAVTPVDVSTAQKILQYGGTTRTLEGPAPRFKVGDKIVAKNIHPVEHTRMPRYVRGKRGIIECDHGAFSLPDSNARNEGPDLQHCYGVRFRADELWGPDASPRDTLQLNLFDDYLEMAP